MLPLQLDLGSFFIFHTARRQAEYGEYGEEDSMFNLFDPDMLFRIPALLIALTVHEYAHAKVAVAFGDPTPRLMGRLTLNPIAHLDPIGLIMLWVFKFGWAKPVPVNPYYFRSVRHGMLWVSLAGPASNILTAFVCAAILALFTKLHFFGLVWNKILWMTYTYNLVFAIFNLVPLPPLDGSKVLSSLLPGRQAGLFDRIEPYGPFILMGLVYVGVIAAVTSPIEMGLHRLIMAVVSLII